MLNELEVFRLLKTTFNGTIRLVTQPDHAAVSGYMASHWGNEEFSNNRRLRSIG